MLHRKPQDNSQNTFSFDLDREEGTTYYFTLKGQIFVKEAACMERALIRAEREGCTHIIINMSSVKAFSSSAIRVVLSFYKRMKNVGGTLKIESPAENVVNTIGLVALDELLLKHEKEVTLAANLEKFDELIGFVNEFIKDAEIDTDVCSDLLVAVEEIFVNIASYAYPGGEGDVTVRLISEEDKMTIIFIDNGIPYDPLSNSDPDISLSIEERKIGGLGVFMVKEMMDKISYEYKDGQNILIIEKNSG